MKNILLIAAFLISVNLIGQYSIQSSKHSIGDIKYDFPVLRGADSVVVAKINTKLQEDLLDHPYQGKGENIFENLDNQNEFEGYPRVNDLTYHLNLLTESLLSIEVEADFCGAYCENATYRYVFCLLTGDRMSLTDVFKPSKHEILLDKLNNLRFSEIHDLLLIRNEEYLSKSKYPLDSLEFADFLWIYEDCLNSIDESLDWYSFQLISNRIYIYRGRCSPHVVRALDELGEFQWDYDIKRLAAFINPEFLKLI